MMNTCPLDNSELREAAGYSSYVAVQNDDFDDDDHAA